MKGEVDIVSSPFPVDGYFNQWSDWSNCSVSCATGSQTRHRICVEPRYGGQKCSGETIEEKNCSMVECPGKFRFFTVKKVISA